MHLVRDFHTNNHMYVKIAMLPGMKFCVKLAGKVTLCLKREEADSDRSWEPWLNQVAGGGERRKDNYVPEVLIPGSGDH